MAEQLLKDKVIVVTGAGRGIGRAISLMAAEYGASVVVNDIGVEADGRGGDETDNSPAADVVREIEAMGGKAVTSYASVSDWDGAQQIIQTAIDTFGRVDAVVNNAGILRDVIFHKMTEEQFDSVIAVHLKGSFNMSKAAAQYFKEQNSGSFVHMTSTSGLIGNFGQANYSAAKLGIVGLSKSIALDMSRFGVRSNCVAPFAWSRMTASIPAKNDEERARLDNLQKMTPDKIASLVVSLCAEGSKDITGQIFSVRKNEIFLFSQPRPIRSAHTAEGWTPETILSRVMPAFKADMYGLDRSADVFSWEPI